MQLAYIELGKLLTGARDPLVLLVSGGHTMLLSFLNQQWSKFLVKHWILH